MSERLFNLGDLLVWSPSLVGLAFDAIGKSYWLNRLGSELTSKHCNGVYGERNLAHREENRKAIESGTGWVTSRYTVSEETIYIITLFPLSTEPFKNKTYIVSSQDLGEFKQKVLEGREDVKQGLKNLDKAKAAKRKASKKRQQQAQETLLTEVDHHAATAY